MRWLLVLVLATACGRIEFSPRTDGGGGDSGGDSTDDVAPVCTDAVGHDEDGDTVDDACDVCPHLVDPTQLDTDGDRIGNACDPEPTNPRQRLALFASMRPGDQPFTALASGGSWTQLADSYAYDGVLYGGIDTDVVVANAVVALGFTVTGETGGPDAQHQIQVYPQDDSGAFTELGFNGTGANNVADATVAYFDGATYVNYLTQPTASGIHPGAMTITGTWIVGTSVALDAGWSGEPYHIDLAPFANHQGGQHVQLDSNNVAYRVDWVCVIAW